ncbi:hypothetical protein [Bacillus sp. PS06]|uniref:hypothetical protein n=1 Tax=Bacillus sp. PS06 TaxID=2764176 RepID=UPI0017845CCE|nr:hypothetical protein [Bacillus sp. PS06]MBD8068082.1 hypothetical protein [Bacillus sp. PS06]
MKKVYCFIIIVLIMLASCDRGPFTSTTSQLIVMEKGHSSDYKEYWIKAYDPNNQGKEEAFKVVVQEEMVWHLIEKDKEYFSSYTKEGDKPWVLEQIEHVEIEKE